MRVNLIAQRADLRLLRLDGKLGGAPLLLLHPDAVGQSEIGRGPAEIEPEPVHQRIEEIAEKALAPGVENNGIADRLNTGGGQRERGAQRRLLDEFATPERAQTAVEQIAQKRAE